MIRTKSLRLAWVMFIAFCLMSLSVVAIAAGSASQAIVKVMPDYPRVAWVDRIEGNVQVRFNVNAQGVVENIRIVRSSHPVFETNVMDAVSRFRFNPGRQNGVTETFRFTLEGADYDPEPVVTSAGNS